MPTLTTRSTVSKANACVRVLVATWRHRTWSHDSSSSSMHTAPQDHQSTHLERRTATRRQQREQHEHERFVRVPHPHERSCHASEPLRPQRRHSTPPPQHDAPQHAARARESCARPSDQTDKRLCTSTARATDMARHATHLVQHRVARVQHRFDDARHAARVHRMEPLDKDRRRLQQSHHTSQDTARRRTTRQGTEQETQQPSSARLATAAAAHAKRLHSHVARTSHGDAPGRDSHSWGTQSPRRGSRAGPGCRRRSASSQRTAAASGRSVCHVHVCEGKQRASARARRERTMPAVGHRRL